jgi:glycosyltransferase involved in cell wall biosynthesis
VTTAESGERLPKCVAEARQIVSATGLDSRAQARSASIEVNRLRLLYVGRLVYWKGVQFAIEAVTDAVDEGLPVSLTIVGKGALESRLKRLVAERGMERRISFVPWLPREGLGIIYSEHDAFIFPSFQDSGGSAVLEAMSHGLPVICLDVGGPGISVNQSSGIKVAIRDESQLLGDLGSAIETLFRNPELRASMGAAARERSIVDFGWDRLEQVLNTLYAEAVIQRPMTNRPNL